MLPINDATFQGFDASTDPHVARSSNPNASTVQHVPHAVATFLVVPPAPAVVVQNAQTQSHNAHTDLHDV